MRNIKLIIQYDGSFFYGWQKQSHVLTIQEKIEKILFLIVKDKVNLVASGRTDRGVHAFAQVANFRTNSNISCENLTLALNSKLSVDVRIINCEDVDLNFHARFSVIKREYMYFIYNNSICPPFKYKYVHHVKWSINLDKLKETLYEFIGEHDFSSFSSANEPILNKICIIHKITINQKNKEIIIMIQANRFLRKMIRMIIGFSLAINYKNISVKDEVKKIFLLKNRRSHSYPTSPAKGLFLTFVYY